MQHLALILSAHDINKSKFSLGKYAIKNAVANLNIAELGLVIQIKSNNYISTEA